MTSCHVMSSTQKERPLEAGFEPGPFDVICSRGKQFFNHIGNARFRSIVDNHINDYYRARSKLEKGRLVMSIVQEVRGASRGGGFVRFSAERGCYVEIGDEMAREKVGHAIRERMRIEKRKGRISLSSITRFHKIDDENSVEPGNCEEKHSSKMEESGVFIYPTSQFMSAECCGAVSKNLWFVAQYPGDELSVARAFACAFEVSSEHSMDDSDLPDNFDIDTIF